VKTSIAQLLSYVSGTVIERRPSTISGELEVWYQNGKYVLHAPEANYSYDTLHRVFQRAFKMMEVKHRNPQTALILGFGAGSIATILCEELRLSPRLTGVEIDPEVIALGKKYFNLDRFKNLELHCADAAGFIASCDAHFDLVVSDVFVDKQQPAAAKSLSYLSDLVRITKTKGLGMINCIVETRQQRKELAQQIEQLNALGVTCKTTSVTPINTIISWIKSNITY
jgi:spermidine synthase